MQTQSEIDAQFRASWQVPAFETRRWQGRLHDYCVVVPVINEGGRIHRLIERMMAIGIPRMADLVIVDGGSTDGSLDPGFPGSDSVRALLVKTGPGKLSAQLRCAYAFVLDQGYRGIVTIDGNDKDDPAAITSFIAAIESGVDFVQGSRFIRGGVGENTPKLREMAIRWIHAPALSLCSGFSWTDTTQGFRAYSRRLLLDPRLNVFRDVFSGYELLAYLSCRAPSLGYLCRELPTRRSYPDKGEIPTKISGLRGNIALLATLLKTCIGGYNK